MKQNIQLLQILALALSLSACGGGKGSSSPTAQSAAAHLTVNKAGSGTGTVTSSPGSISCGSVCDNGFSSGTSIQLSATADSGSTFVGWNSSNSNVNCPDTASCSFTLDNSTTVTATFSTTTVTQAGLHVVIAGSGTVTSNDNSVTCPTDCDGIYNPPGATVTLTAAAASGYTFSGWSGSGVSCPGTGNCSVVMSTDRSVTATFTQNPPPQFQLTVTGNGSGTVSSAPAGISCSSGSGCSASFAQGTSVALSATPASGYSFGGWAGACSGNGACAVSMSAARSVTATFTATLPSTAALNTAVTGSGTVTSSPTGISCGTTCTTNYNVGTSVVLTATPAAGYRVQSWSGGGCPSTGNTCTVSLSASTTVNVVFAPITHTLSVSKQGSGTVTSSPAGIACGATCNSLYNTGTAVTLTAASANGYTFSGWSAGPCSGTGNCVATLSADQSVTATFTANYLLSVTASGSGNVSSSVGGIASCSATCTASLASGTSVVLTASPSSGYTFSGWSGGGCSGSSSTCTVSMTAAKSVTATFAASGGSSTGKSYYVSNSGSDSNNGTAIATPFKTINKAVGVAAPGDTIEVLAGTYNEAVVIRNAGTSSAWITLRGYNGAWPVIRRPAGAGPSVYFYNNACDEGTIGTGTGNTDCFASYWVLQGLVIQGSTGGGADGNAIKIDTAKVRLQGNKLCCSEADVVKLVRTSNDIELLNNEIWQDASITVPSNNAQGIDIVGADRTRIAGNYVHNVPDIGMYAKGNARNTVFENNLLMNIGGADNGHAIMVGQDTDVDKLVDGVYETYDAIVRNNVVVNATWACVATSSSSNVRIYNNSCYNTGSATHGSIFLSNESELGTKGINIEVVNNIIYGSASHPLISVTADALSNYSTLRVSNNIYFAIGGAPSFQPNADNSALTFAQWQTQYRALSGNTDNSRVIDPQYATTTGATPLRLNLTSPAINAGQATTLVPTDFLGTARPQGGAIDIGAYEY